MIRRAVARLLAVGCSSCRANAHLHLCWERLEDRALLSTFTVTNTLDNGDDTNPVANSLRAAIVASNADCDPAGATINFNMDPLDQNHGYYVDDTLALQLGRDRIAATQATDDASLPDADPDHRQSWWTITPVAPLPVMTNKVLIDGYSQPGSRANELREGDDAVLRIELAVWGLRIGDGSSIRGMVINRVPRIGNGGYGIELGGGSTLVEGNFIGTDVSGTLPLANDVGISCFLSGATIGGTTPHTRNIISGNQTGIINNINAGPTHVLGNYIGTDPGGTHAVGNGEGLYAYDTIIIGGTGAGAGNLISGNYSGIRLIGFNAPGVVQGNLIGTDVTGTAALGNFNGIVIDYGGNGTIGGTADGAGNVISGNGIGVGGLFNGIQIAGNLIGTNRYGTAAVGNSYGFYLDGTTNCTIGGVTPGSRNIISGNGTGISLRSSNPSLLATGNIVLGNSIGTDLTGRFAVGNYAGIWFGNNVSGNTIGGTTPQSRNIISGNASFAISLSLANNTTIQGNFIGTDQTGTLAVGNGGGVLLADASLSNTIGGTGPGQGNVIANSVNSGGISIDSYTASGTTPSRSSFRGNLIHDNAGLGIDLGNDGVTPNDSHAGPSGPNDWQNFPVLSAAYAGASTVVEGNLHSKPNQAFTIDFYGNSARDSTGHGEGQVYLGSWSVQTGPTGDVNFTATGLAPVGLGQWISATTTDSAGNSSEFSRDIVASYRFSGFLAPLNTGISYALGRTIPIQFTLTDSEGTPVTSLAVVASLKILPLSPSGVLFDPASSDGKGLRAVGGEFHLNWQTKGLVAGSYQIQLTLADGSTQLKTIQLKAGNGPAGLIADSAGTSGTNVSGSLLGGDLTVTVNDPGALLWADAEARIADAILIAGRMVASYGVTITLIDPSSGPADVTIDMSSIGAVGGYSNGVLGSQSGTHVTLIQGWDWYAGSDSTAIAQFQYDLETVVIHELGHVLGLGHSADPTSVMSATLGTGKVNRNLSGADLNVPDADSGAPAGLLVRLPGRFTHIPAPFPTAKYQSNPVEFSAALAAIDQALMLWVPRRSPAPGTALSRSRVHPTTYGA